MKLDRLLFLGLSVVCIASVNSQSREFYKEPSWKPRISLTYDEVISGKFWPKSPIGSEWTPDLTFDRSRVSKIPAPGVHPRVLITPKEVDIIRERVKMGERAPKHFIEMWKRVKEKKTPFYALVMNDKELGRKLVEQLMIKVDRLEPKIDKLNSLSDACNLWSAERSIVALGEPDPPIEIWHLLEYDYLAPWMTKAEKERVRNVVAKIIERRVTNFMMVPDHFMINNHQGFGMEYIRLMLLIEGEKGFDKKLFERASQKAYAMLDYFLDDAGMCYETIKGWLNTSAFVAVGLRNPKIFQHPHLRAKMEFFHAAMWCENGKWKIRDEMRASAFHPIWMMHYYHPTDKGIDFLYKASLDSHEFLTDSKVRWPNPVGICQELLLLYADAGMKDKDGKILDWNNQEQVDALNLPITWKDDERGYLYVRNSWNKGDMQFAMSCKQDFYYGGHEGTENNRIIMWKDGVNWIKDNDMLATKATFLQNMMTIDGKGCKWPPVPSTWLGVNESEEAVSASGDGRNGFSYTKVMQVHPYYFPSSEVPYYRPFVDVNKDLTRDIQVAFHPNTVKFNDGYAHTDYGPWSGETRLVEGYKEWNMMDTYFRTVQFAKGKYPYLLVFDDANKDGKKHLYDWNISLPANVELIEAKTPEIRFQNTDPDVNRIDDLILGIRNRERDYKNGKPVYRKGEPLCLVRVLWRNSEYGFPVPRFEKYQGYNQVVVPSITESPEFKILVYPYRYGDPMPITSYDQKRNKLFINIGNVNDEYSLDTTDGGRTVFAMTRNGNRVLSSNAKPARPVLLIDGESYDSYSFRDTRDADVVPEYIFVDKDTVLFERVQEPAEIRYTLDGSEPDKTSILYDKGIVIKESTSIKAKVINPEWCQGNIESEALNVNFKKVDYLTGMQNLNNNTVNGVRARVYEINTKLYDDKGFFDADKIMLPNLDKYETSFDGRLNEIYIPHTTPKAEVKQQCKAFYRFNGYVFIDADDIYRFDINSCGPVLLNISGYNVIEQVGVFHQQQKIRTGHVALAKGWHEYELIVCDPLYWNVNSLDLMPFEINCRNSDLMNYKLSTNVFACSRDVKEVSDELLSIEPMLEIPKMRKGLNLYYYDCLKRVNKPDFLDIEDLHPYREEYVKELIEIEGKGCVRSYEGFFYAPQDGVYMFDTQKRNGEGQSLGGRLETCINQLRVSGEVVVQRGVYGRNPSRKVQLKKGWYPISLRFEVSGVDVTVVYPDGTSLQLNGDNLYCSETIISKVDKTKNMLPLGIIDFSKWDGKQGKFDIGTNFDVWVGYGAKKMNIDGYTTIETPYNDNMFSTSVDVNVARDYIIPGFRIHNLKLNENALTIAIWFKSDENKGSLFGKKGYNAFGKGYKTVSCDLNNGTLYANPGRLRSKKMNNDQWNYVVMTASESEIKLYLNESLVSVSPGSTQIKTDALDFLLNTHAYVRKVIVYNRVIDESEVKLIND